ncbi:hypothetical protein [Nocardia arthritidis]|uniref:Ig-like domain-containing protein n=1 Tax=Nocardia arthritidis TaxID=228602 RepID=A0A6G9YDB1_9NOCA|nr:hypothetical protein [Nocardia arthritidis]QIS11154.1 hypothetical protein F5544_16375 [Nocardia arthritidis]
MTEIKRLWSGAAVLAAAIGITVATAASAAAGVTDPLDPRVLPHSAPTNGVYAIGCWTTFAPPSPQGGRLVHYYANCAAGGVRVCPAVDYQGHRTIYSQEATSTGGYDGVADGSDTVEWVYNETLPADAAYTTVSC